jgi:hypothetical protein
MGTTFECYIFNRWGELIWEGSSIDDKWDGTVKGSGIVAKTEVYVWLIRTMDHKLQPHE